MKISNEIKLLIDGIQKEYKTKDDIYFFTKKETAYKNTNAIYVISYKDYDIEDPSILFLGIVDVEKEKFIYINNNKKNIYIKQILDKKYHRINLEDLYEQKINEVNQILVGKLLEYAKNSTIKYLCKECTELLRNDYVARLLFINHLNTTEDDYEAMYYETFNFEDYIEEVNSIKLICTLYNEPDKIYEEVINNYKKEENEDFKMLVSFTKKITEIIKEKNDDNYKQIREDIVNIIKNTKSKTLTVKYTTLHNEKHKAKFDIKELREHTGEIYIDSTLGIEPKIPLTAINSIYCSNKKVYDKKNYNLENDEKAYLQWANTDFVDEFDEKYFNDPEFMYQMIIYNHENIKFIGDKLLNNHKFIMKIINQFNEVSDFDLTKFNKKLFKNDKFLNVFFKPKFKDMIKTAEFEYILENIDNSYFKNINKMKKLLNICDYQNYNKVLLKLDKKTLNNPDIIDFLDTPYVRTIPDWVLYEIKDTNILYEVSKRQYEFAVLIAKGMDESYDILKADFDFMIYLLKDYKYYVKNIKTVCEKLIKDYEHDTEALYKILSVTPLYLLKDILLLIGVSIVDTDKIFELATINVNILALLHKKDIYTYLIGEALEVCNLFVDKYTLTIKTAYNYFMYKIDEQELTFEDKNRNKIDVSTVLDSASIEEITDTLIKSIIEFNDKFVDCTDLLEIANQMKKSL